MKKNKLFPMAIVVAVFLALFVAGCKDVISLNPILTVSPSALYFANDITVKSFTIRNAGAAGLNWDIESNESWLEVDITDGSEDRLVNVSVLREGLTAGNYSATIKVNSNYGSADIDVTMSVFDIPKPGMVTDLFVSGMTAPAGSITPALAARILAMPNSGGPGMGTYSNQEIPMPVGYEGSYILSWNEVPYAESYRIYIYNSEAKQYNLWEEIAVEELEDPALPTFIVAGDFDIGQTHKFIVTAVNAKGEGPASEEDSGLIMAPIYLSSPGHLSGAPKQPTFRWLFNSFSTGYIVTLCESRMTNIIWQQVKSRGDSLEAKYPGDEPDPVNLTGGKEYYWFNMAQGPLGEDGSPLSYAISQVWQFSVSE